MFGKLSLSLPARSSSQYLLLWRQCTEVHRPGSSYFPRQCAPPPSGCPARRCLTISTAKRRPGPVAEASAPDSDHTLASEDHFGAETGQRAKLRDNEGKTRRQSSNVSFVEDIPRLCPGCGAHSQTVDPTSPGYYDVQKSRNSGEGSARVSNAKHQEDAVYQSMIQHVPALQAGNLPDSITAPLPALRSNLAIPATICDRCHELRYHSRGESIVHPTMQSIQAIIEESPHKHNHIYHVLDAADFPLSLIPNLQHALNLPRLRTQNRRSKTQKYIRGRVAEVSFIITRSDLLAPKKEQVDTMMPYLQEVLRDALGRSSRNIRLGNVRCVSAKRGWWTRTVKEEIYYRGGAGWMVGKVNVGKSALYEAVYPKGRNQQDISNGRLRQQMSETIMENTSAMANFPTHVEMDETTSQEPEISQTSENKYGSEIQLDIDDEPLDESDDSSLLPPAQPETAYPAMPLVSSLPGTTASPIRIPFGNGKGELIDLPGVHRSTLDMYVKEAHHKDMVMKHRIVPEQHTIRPGQSLVLGGLIRVTNQSPDRIMLAYPFVPPAFEPHVTGTHKAIAIQTGMHSLESRGREGQEYTGTVTSIATDEAKKSMKKAGSFQLEWNATKRRAGPLTDRTAGKQKADDLPFIIYSADLLIESVGWVELACQVRRPKMERATAIPHSDDALSFMEINDAVHEGSKTSTLPVIDVFSPEGKYVGIRRPMNAWILGGPKPVPTHLKRVRPRMSIGMVKRRQSTKIT